MLHKHSPGCWYPPKYSTQANPTQLTSSETCSGRRLRADSAGREERVRMGGKGRKFVASSCAFHCSPSVMPLQVNEDEEQLLFIKTAAHRKEVILFTA
jgi:hypothetical protein